MIDASRKRNRPDGRDEMNLADFPISVLQRQQKSDAAGNKQDRLELGWGQQLTVAVAARRLHLVMEGRAAVTGRCPRRGTP